MAAFAGVLAAPIYQVNPLMGSNLIIVVFAVVVIGGMGSIMGVELRALWLQGVGENHRNDNGVPVECHLEEKLDRIRPPPHEATEAVTAVVAQLRHLGTQRAKRRSPRCRRALVRRQRGEAQLGARVLPEAAVVVGGAARSAPIAAV